MRALIVMVIGISLVVHGWLFSGIFLIFVSIAGWGD
jgi:hypothetical protein